MLRPDKGTRSRPYGSWTRPPDGATTTAGRRTPSRTKTSNERSVSLESDQRLDPRLGGKRAPRLLARTSGPALIHLPAPPPHDHLCGGQRLDSGPSAATRTVDSCPSFRSMSRGWPAATASELSAQRSAMCPESRPSQSTATPKPSTCKVRCRRAPSATPWPPPVTRPTRSRRSSAHRDQVQKHPPTRRETDVHSPRHATAAATRRWWGWLIFAPQFRVIMDTSIIGVAPISAAGDQRPRHRFRRAAAGRRCADLFGDRRIFGVG